MKTELEHQDIEAIAQRIVELLKPFISGNGKHGAEPELLDCINYCVFQIIKLRRIKNT